MLKAGMTGSMLQGMVAANNAVCIGHNALSEDECALISHFVKGVRKLTAHSAVSVAPPWDLDAILSTLQQPLFKPLGNVNLKCLSCLTALLWTVTSIRGVGKLEPVVCVGCCPGPSCLTGLWTLSRRPKLAQKCPLPMVSRLTPLWRLLPLGLCGKELPFLPCVQ